MRNSRVSRPFKNTQALNADNVGPAVRTYGNTLPMMKSLLPTIAPPTILPCPSKYLVAECMTTSAPRANGFWSAGVQKQLSTANKALAFLAILEMALISAISVKGFDGVSK